MIKIMKMIKKNDKNDNSFIWPALYDAEVGEEAEEVGKDRLHAIYF